MTPSQPPFNDGPLRRRAAILALLVACSSVAVAAPIPVPAPATPPQAGAELPLGLPQDVEAAAILLYAEDRRELTDELLLLTGVADPAVRARAALAIGRVGLPLGATRLMELLRDPDASVRALACFGLGLLELDLEPATAEAARRRITERLLPLLDDPSAAVVEQALWALGIRADRAAVPAISAILSAAGPSSISVAALGAWWRLPGVAPSPAARLLESPDPAVRFAAVTALRRLDDPDAMPMLEPALADREPHVRAAAVVGLRQAPPAAARRHLVEMLGDDDWRVVNAALAWAATLWRGGEEIEQEALSAVIAASLRRERHVQRAAFAALALAASDYGVPEDRLVHALRSGDVTTRLAVVDALAAAGGDVLEENLPQVLDVYGIGAPPAEPSASVIPAQLAASPSEAAAVARAIGEAGAGAAVDWLWILAEHGPPAARAEALRQLVSRDPERSVVMAAAWLDTAPAALRAVAAEALARARALGTLPPMPDGSDDWITRLWSAQRELGRSGELEPRLVVLDALSAIGPETLRRRLAALLTDDDRVVRLWAVRNVSPLPDSADAILVAEALRPVETGLTVVDYRRVAVEILALQAEHPRLRVQTARGDLIWELRFDWAPMTARAFLQWIDAGLYDDVTFHRVVAGFVIQAGDPTAIGLGGAPGSLRNEEAPLPYVTGTVGLALAGRDTGGSQFFVAASPQPHLSGLYPVLGTIVAGQRVIGRVQPGDKLRIAREPRP